MITYDPNGFYGHPDHIQAHRVAMRAAELAGEYGPRKIYWTAMPRSVLEGGMEAFRGLDDNPFADVERVEDLPFGHPDEEIAAQIDGTDQYEQKIAAMRAHATQIPDNSWLYGIAGDFGGEFMGVEYFALAKGERGVTGGPNGWESDLFSGLDLRAAGRRLRGRRPVSLGPVSVSGRGQARPETPSRRMSSSRAGASNRRFGRRGCWSPSRHRGHRGGRALPHAAAHRRRTDRRRHPVRRGGELGALPGSPSPPPAGVGRSGRLGRCGRSSCCSPPVPEPPRATT